MRILMVLTSHDQLGDTGLKTAFEKAKLPEDAEATGALIQQLRDR